MNWIGRLVDSTINWKNQNSKITFRIKSIHQFQFEPCARCALIFEFILQFLSLVLISLRQEKKTFLWLFYKLLKKKIFVCVLSSVRCRISAHFLPLDNFNSVMWMNWIEKGKKREKKIYLRKKTGTTHTKETERKKKMWNGRRLKLVLVFVFFFLNIFFTLFIPHSGCIWNFEQMLSAGGNCEHGD